MEQEINKPFKGLHTDLNPKEQPEGSYRYALNAVNENELGDQASLSSEGSNYSTDTITPGYKVIGDKYLENNLNILFSLNPSLGKQEIGLLDGAGKYKPLVNTASLDFKLGHQIDATFRVRRNGDRVIYWVDGYNKPRVINIDRLYIHYTKGFKDFLDAGGDPLNYFSEKWDVSSFNLVKSYSKIPHFNEIEVLDYGQVKPGSYNFAIQYIDEDLNPTEWITVSNPVRIYNTSLNSSFGDIRGSFSVNDFQKFEEADKSIKLYLGNLDTNFPYFRVAVIQANEGVGYVNNAIVSEPQDVNTGVFIYSGNDGSYATIDVNEIRFDREDILAPQHIEQLENRLILANTKGPQYDWCSFQQYASSIKTNLTTELVYLNELKSKGNIKNPHSTFTMRGYLPGEVYSLGIVYLMKDFTYSPVFHIPGRSEDIVSDMDVYLSESVYPDIHNCKPTDNYWGLDYAGKPLVGTNVRFHKFPTRKSMDYSLYNKSDVVVPYYQHALKMIVTLKKDKEFPTDSNNNPLILDFEAEYKILGQSPTTFLGSIAESTLGAEIIIAQSTETTNTYYDEVSPGNYVELDPDSELLDYMITGNEYFNIEFQYSLIPTDTVLENVSSHLFGLDFSNIVKPHPDVIGFFIVRNEVTDADKLVIDNVIVGPNVKSNEYIAFTHFTPGFVENKFDKRSVWFFSPEVNFNKKNLGFNAIEIQGLYKVVMYQRPIKWIAQREQFAENPNETLSALYIGDVQAGSSYNPEVHKKREKDSDGFALQAAYKYNVIEFDNNYGGGLPIPTDSFILDAASNRVISGNIYYNVSTDNKISMATFGEDIAVEDFVDYDVELDTITYVPLDSNYINADHPAKNLFYATLKRGAMVGGVWQDARNSYQDFMTRPYYKEHHNPHYFGNSMVLNNIRVFNGDAEISCMTLTNSLFRQLYIKPRQTKRSLWRYIIGAIIMVVGVVAGYFTGGISISAGISLGMAVIAAGAMFVHSGIKLDNLIAMFNEDYSKGLLEAIEDTFVRLYLGNTLKVGPNSPTYIPLPDDTIQWFFDILGNVYIESRVPIGLRSGVSVGQVTDFMNAPKPYSQSVIENYITEKITWFDRDQGGGRLYRGIANAEVYSVNPDYSRFNKEKAYIHLPTSYSCCGNNIEKYPTRVWYSQQSFQEELIDNYRSFLPNNYRDVEGENGEITDLYKIGNSLFIHTSEALWQLPQNMQERTTNELTTYIGTGEFFSIPPRKIVDDTLGSGGTKHKWATVKTKQGVFFVSSIENKFYLHSQGLKDMSMLGIKNWSEENVVMRLAQQVFNLSGVNYKYDNNPANPVGIGFLATYDTRFERILVTKKDYSLLKTLRTINSSVIETTPIPSPYKYSGIEVVFNKATGTFWRVNLYKNGTNTITRNAGEITSFKDFPEVFREESFTLSYSFYTDSWVSFHSYLPNYYISNQRDFYSMLNSKNNFYRHNSPSRVLEFYDTSYPYIIEFVSNKNPMYNKIWEDITFTTTARKWDESNMEYVDIPDVTYTKAIFYNSRQCSGEQILLYKDTEANPFSLESQVGDTSGTIILDRRERNWSLNDLRDYVVDYTQPLFTRDWSKMSLEYPIDKVVNTTVIDFNKPWDEVESFRDKYLIMRFKFDNFVDVKLTTHFFIESQTISER
jgi:hypothetical protein